MPKITYNLEGDPDALRAIKALQDENDRLRRSLQDIEKLSKNSAEVRGLEDWAWRETLRGIATRAWTALQKP